MDSSGQHGKQRVLWADSTSICQSAYIDSTSQDNKHRFLWTVSSTHHCMHEPVSVDGTSHNNKHRFLWTVSSSQHDMHEPVSVDATSQYRREFEFPAAGRTSDCDESRSPAMASYRQCPRFATDGQFHAPINQSSEGFWKSVEQRR